MGLTNYWDLVQACERKHFSHRFLYLSHICSLKLSEIVVIHLTALEAHFMFARSQVALQMPIFLSFCRSRISYTRTFQFLCMSYDCYIMTLWPDTLFLHQVLWFSLLWAAVQNITSAVPGHYITGGLIYWFQSVNWVQFYAKIINEHGGGLVWFIIVGLELKTIGYTTSLLHWGIYQARFGIRSLVAKYAVTNSVRKLRWHCITFVTSYRN
jgi:hypothetical protein